MNNKTRTLFLFFIAIAALTACRKKAFDEYYGRPASLEPPIYKTLEAKGRFKTLLAAIDKSGYKNTLSAAGYWTFFAPNDSAFQVYFRENNISGIEKLDSTACQKIVTYCLVYNAFNKDRIDDYQSNTGWVVNTAFKRRTANYTGVYNTTDTSGNNILAIAANRNGVLYVEADQNNKYIPIFTDTFFRNSALSATDYTYFYPNTQFTGYNVADAQVLEKNIPAENGVINEVNRVISALPSIDQYLGSKPEYSLFKSLFDKYLVSYVLNPPVTLRWNNQGKPGQVFTKVYDANLAFAPNNENYLKVQDNDGQSNTFTLFVPTNTVLQSYISGVLLEYYPVGSTLASVPRSIVYDLINAHMWQTPVWPSRFSTTPNFQGEEARFNPSTNITDKKILSNGFLYGTNKVQEANVFTTVYGRIYLDPNYSIMRELVNRELRSAISNPAQLYTIFMMSDAAFAAEGYVQDVTLNPDFTQQWRFTPPAGSIATAVTGTAAYQRMIRMVYMHVVEGDITSLAGTGVARTFGGEYINWNANRVQAGGNVESTVLLNKWANITGTKTSKNGRVYYFDKLLTFSELPIARHIENLATAQPAVYNKYWQYLKNSTIYTAATNVIAGVNAGSFYTVLIPTNAAIDSAVANGVLPASTTSTLPIDQIKVANFLQYHILKRAEGTDGIDRGSSETVLINSSTGNATSVFVKNFTTSLQFRDEVDGPLPPGAPFTFRAQTVTGYSNYLSNRCVIHVIDKYLRRL